MEHKYWLVCWMGMEIAAFNFNEENKAKQYCDEKNKNIINEVRKYYYELVIEN